MRVLDLYCGAGMASDGYTRAGHTVEGVDITPQPDYPYPFTQGDALGVLSSALPEQYDAIHASPPCQAHTRAKHLRDAQGGTSKALDLLTPTLALLREHWGHKVWIVENVPGAPGMDDAVVECGSAYGLDVQRHRLFLSNVELTGSGCDHKRFPLDPITGKPRPWGVYHVLADNVPSGGRTVEHGWAAMGVDRQIPWDSLKEGFPPAYTEHLGRQLALAVI